MNRPLLRGQCRPVLAALALAVAGCTGPLDPTTRPAIPAAAGLASSGIETGTVGPASQAGFFPLRVGNRWDYLQGVLTGVVPDSGAPSLEVSESVIRSELIAVQVIGEREYMIERVTEDGPNGPFEWAVFHRQDITGLYEFEAIRAAGPGAGGSGSEDATRAFSWIDAAAARRILEGRPAAERDAYRLAALRLDERIAALQAVIRTPSASIAARLPGTAEPFELTRLRYPLAPKSRWAIGAGPPFPFVAEVVGAEQVRLLPPLGQRFGYRIRITSELFGPNDLIQVWYGPSGLLRLRTRLESVATDSNGNPVGRWIYDQERILQDQRLLGSEVVALPPWIQHPVK